MRDKDNILCNHHRHTDFKLGNKRKENKNLIHVKSFKNVVNINFYLSGKHADVYQEKIFKKELDSNNSHYLLVLFVLNIINGGVVGNRS